MRCGWSTAASAQALKTISTTTRSPPPGRRAGEAQQRWFDRRSARLVGADRGGDRSAARPAPRGPRTASRCEPDPGRPDPPRAPRASPGSSSPRPDPAPSASPGRRPTRSSCRRTAARRSLPSRCAAKIRLLAVTPEPQLATNGCAGSTPASANSRRISSMRLEACRRRGRATRTAGCGRPAHGPARRRGAGRARCPRTAPCRERRASGSPMPASSCCLVTTSSRFDAPRSALGAARASPLSVGRPSASHFWKPPSRIATCSAPKWRSMNQPRAAFRSANCRRRRCGRRGRCRARSIAAPNSRRGRAACAARGSTCR